jgi:hypothetical protein
MSLEGSTKLISIQIRNNKDDVTRERKQRDILYAPIKVITLTRRIEVITTGVAISIILQVPQ